jgi:hypothetical protein
MMTEAVNIDPESGYVEASILFVRLGGLLKQLLEVLDASTSNTMMSMCRASEACPNRTPRKCQCRGVARIVQGKDSRKSCSGALER